MRTLRIMAGLTITWAVIVGFSLEAWAQDKEEGFRPLGNGKDLSGFDLIGTTESTWTVDGDVIKCSGKPNGDCVTKKSYKNFVLRFDFKYVRPEGLEDESKFRGNSGYLIYITGEQKVWPKCIEVQGMNLNVGQILFVSGYPKVKAMDYPEARKKALKPVGQWNSMEIISKDGALTAILDGAKVAECEAGEIKEGSIGFQSEGAEIHFRKLRIKEQ
jgi:hypothetical protein